MLLGTLAGSLFRNMLANERVIRGGDQVIRASEGVIRAEQNF